MAKIALVLLIALLFAVVAKLFARASRLSYNPKWHTFLELAEKLTKNDEKVRKAIIYAMRDRSITSELSQFRLIAEDEFAENLGGWLDEDTPLEDVPAAVFKTVLHGYGYMGYMGWQSPEGLEELIHQYNRAASTWQLPQLEGELAEEITTHFKATANSEQALAIAINAINHFAQDSHRELLWLDENGDGYAFFLVTESTAKELKGQAIDSNHSFLEHPPTTQSL